MPMRRAMVRLVWGLSVALSASAWSQDGGQGQFDFANGLFGRGFYKEAADEYALYLKEHPNGENATVATHRLAESQHASGAFESALKTFSELEKREGVGGELKLKAQLGRGKSLFGLNRHDEALEAIANLDVSGANETIRGERLYYLGKIQFERKKYVPAADAFTALVREIPNSPLAPYARYQAAFAYLGANDGEKAAIEFSAVAGMEGVDEKLRMECRFRAAETYDKIGWYDTALTAYEQLRTEFPESAYAQRASYGYAWALYRSEKFAEALEASSKYLEAYPESAERAGIDYLRGVCRQQLKQYDEAVAIFRALADDANAGAFRPRARYKLAWTYYLMDRHLDARAELERLVAANEGGTLLGDAAFLLGSIEAADGNWEQAYERFRFVAEEHPESEFATEALYKSGESLYTLGRMGDAAGVFERFLEQHGQNALATEARLKAGDARFLSASFSEAVKHYQAALDGELADASRESALYRLAVTHHNLQDLAKSAETFEALLKAYPETSHAAEAYLRLGDYYVRDEKDIVRAVEMFEASIREDEAGAYRGESLKGLALARYATKDLDGAAEMFLNLIQEYPDVTLNEDAYAWLGQHLFDQKKYSDAATAFEALLAYRPDYPKPERLLFKIAECKQQDGKAEEALAGFQKVIDAAPGSALATESTYRMARMYEALDKPAEARERYQQAANTNTGEVAARARFRLGELAESEGQFDDAARNYMRVAILFLHEELSPESLLRAARCFEKDGKPSQAAKTYREVVEVFPESSQAQAAKEGLAALPAGEASN